MEKTQTETNKTKREQDALLSDVCSPEFKAACAELFGAGARRRAKTDPEEADFLRQGWRQGMNERITLLSKQLKRYGACITPEEQQAIVKAAKADEMRHFKKCTAGFARSTTAA
jgi:hypothetical protein